ncbi:Rho-binding antiterminator [Halopseudomonas xiamenensis]|uniref:Rho-binding antiterminator n=1 Tax=Halopseudomonas xiamenensis TaxID=157792 RepID=UPI0016293C2F|nr:Rho-binding antiterminator [Halopseudomonas xiamenensis]
MITCDQSDYLEIACLYRIPIALSWADGRRVEGTPLDTGYNEQRQECLLMVVGDREEWVVLDGVQSMTALVENPHFAQIRFGEAF